MAVIGNSAAAGRDKGSSTQHGEKDARVAACPLGLQEQRTLNLCWDALLSAPLRAQRWRQKTGMFCTCLPPCIGKIKALGIRKGSQISPGISCLQVPGCSVRDGGMLLTEWTEWFWLSTASVCCPAPSRVRGTSKRFAGTCQRYPPTSKHLGKTAVAIMSRWTQLAPSPVSYYKHLRSSSVCFFFFSFSLTS